MTEMSEEKQDVTKIDNLDGDEICLNDLVERDAIDLDVVSKEIDREPVLNKRFTFKKDLIADLKKLGCPLSDRKHQRMKKSDLEIELAKHFTENVEHLNEDENQKVSPKMAFDVL